MLTPYFVRKTPKEKAEPRTSQVELDRTIALQDIPRSNSKAIKLISSVFSSLSHSLLYVTNASSSPSSPFLCVTNQRGQREVNAGMTRSGTSAVKHWGTNDGGPITLHKQCQWQYCCLGMGWKWVQLRNLDSLSFNQFCVFPVATILFPKFEKMEDSWGLDFPSDKCRHRRLKRFSSLVWGNGERMGSFLSGDLSNSWCFSPVD